MGLENPPPDEKSGQVRRGAAPFYLWFGVVPLRARPAKAPYGRAAETLQTTWVILFRGVFKQLIINTFFENKLAIFPTLKQLYLYSIIIMRERHYLLLLCCLLAGINLTAQNLTTKDTEKNQLCDSSKVYAVDHLMLEEKYGKMKHPKTTAQYSGGIDELKKYFEANSLTAEIALNKLLRVNISFTVNCEGRTGNFNILSKGKGDLETIARLVLDLTSNMPSRWQPAKSMGKPVDSYQVLWFTLTNGKFTQVHYN
jgi:hypothetical protein